MKDLTLYVKEATREQPISELETILIKLEGIERALVDIQDGEVKIVYNEDQVSPEVIKNRIKQHGMHIQ